MQLPDRKGVLVENPNLLAQAKFVQLVLAEFPQLHEEFAEAEGLLHVAMGTFSRFAQNAIDHNDLDTLKRCYGLLAGIMKTAALPRSRMQSTSHSWSILILRGRPMAPRQDVFCHPC
jgi:hypothetical protein